MKVTVQYFGGLRARLGQSEAVLELAEGTTAAIAAHEICRSLGAEWPSALRAAVNEEMVPMGTVLKEGDVLALLPPVSGG